MASAALPLLFVGSVVGCDEDKLTGSELEFDEVGRSSLAAVDQLGRIWQLDESDRLIVVIDRDGEIVDRYELEDHIEGIRDIEVTETHVYVLTLDDTEPVIVRAGRNDVVPSDWKNFPIPAGNLHEVTGLGKTADGVLSLEVAFGADHVPLVAANRNLDEPAEQPVVLFPDTAVRFDVSGYFPASSDYVVVGTRLLDTRLNDPQYPGPLVGTTTLDVTLAGRVGLPQANGLGAVVLNVTVVPQKAGYLTAYPDASIPATSNINFADGETTAGMVVIAPGADGKISLRHTAAQGSSHVVVDVLGYFPPSADVHMVQPLRVFDTRQAQYGPKMGAGATRQVQIGGIGPIPMQVGSIIANVTAVSPAGYGSATIYEAGTPMPDSGCIYPEIPNLLYNGTTRANLVIIPLSDNGRAVIHTTQNAHYIVDVLGWFGQGGDYEPIEPLCVMDTSGPVYGLEDGMWIDIGFPVDAVPSGAKAVFGNLTALFPTGNGYLQTYPVPADPNNVPNTSSINFNAGKTVSNSITTGLSAWDEFRVMARLP